VTGRILNVEGGSRKRGIELRVNDIDCIDLAALELTNQIIDELGCILRGGTIGDVGATRFDRTTNVTK
jgi:hypothetical protein